MKCKGCFYYKFEKQHCKRYPQPINKMGDDWCGEWRENASKIEKTAESDGNSGAFTGETLQEKPGLKKNDEESTFGVRIDTGETPSEKESKEKTVKKRGWPKGKPRK